MPRVTTGGLYWVLPMSVAAALSMVLPAQVRAQGDNDYPIPSSAAQAFSAIREGFAVPLEPLEGLKGPRDGLERSPVREGQREERLQERRRERMPGAHSFFKDTELYAHSRTYWFDEHDFGFDDPKAFTTGGWLAYRSGVLADFFQLSSVLYTSQPLFANATAGQTLNLDTDGDQITTLGQINGKFTYAGQELTAGRQLVRTPFINPYDVRMIPLTFEGVVLVPKDRGLGDGFDYIASYLTRYKPREQSNFVSFSEGLGVSKDAGVLINGLSYHGGGWSIGGTNYWIKDTLNTAYGEIDYLFPRLGSSKGAGENKRAPNDAPRFRAGINFLDQRSVGEDLIAGAPYDTYQISARLIGSYKGFVLTGAVSTTGNEASIQNPYGFSTSYTGMDISNFGQASVDAYLLRLSYDLARIGFEGVKVEAAYGWGFGEPDLETNGDFADQEELDLRFVYEPLRGRLKGLRVEVEYIDWQVFDPDLPSDTLSQFRTIVNYKLPLM